MAWFNRLRQQLVDMRALFRKDSAVSSVRTLLRHRELLDKVWAAFLTAYVDVILKSPKDCTVVGLSLARSNAAAVYTDAKDLLETSYNVVAALDDSVQPLEDHQLGFKIEDHLLSIISLPKMEYFDSIQLRELIDQVVFHSRMVERAYAATCPMLLSVTLQLKLDDETLAIWKAVEDLAQPPNIHSLVNFLEERWAEEYRRERCDVKPVTVDQQIKEVAVEPTYLPDRPQQTFLQFCRCCRSVGHQLGKCGRFQRWFLRRRVEFLKRHRLCANCFKDHDGHESDRCWSRARCFNCGEKHHYLVCYYDPRVNFNQQENYYACDAVGFYSFQPNNHY